MELRKEARVFVKTGFTDMRKQINGLAAIVQQLRPEGLFEGSYFVFCGKTRRVAKILYWDKTGFCLWQKRLEQETFPWPRKGSELDEITDRTSGSYSRASMSGKSIKRSATR